MKFYIGGRGQGKLTAAIKDIESEYIIIDENNLTEDRLTEENLTEGKLTNDRLMSLEKLLCDIEPDEGKIYVINHLQLIVRRLILSGISEEPIYSLIDDICSHKTAVVISDEIGNGIVPLEKEDRLYRDIVGECQQKLAAGAEAVYRVYCGICQRLK